MLLEYHFDYLCKHKISLILQRLESFLRLQWVAILNLEQVTPKDFFDKWYL